MGGNWLAGYLLLIQSFTALCWTRYSVLKATEDVALAAIVRMAVKTCLASSFDFTFFFGLDSEIGFG